MSRAKQGSAKQARLDAGLLYNQIASLTGLCGRTFSGALANDEHGVIGQVKSWSGEGLLLSPIDALTAFDPPSL
ncbi:MAG: hypothetical protein J0I01_12370 [Stenotrophomonas nitritireducens]|uniref:hypothetical protein n=1 Tax=Stenotrophomonas nitritireducens TaxID=83617 RepID=UPI001ACBFF37|nr:hypothetical protein [Stenotrophomonas nitritireducens]MBN8768977.1 hypothetical protein [Stenotrophomonas sp.]MBN8793015.1 hypothetical protein [Stenotrophomonas nitritireducens]